MYIGYDCTVAKLKHEIERITRAPAADQVLTCSEIVLNDESASMRQLESKHGAPLVVMLIVPNWTDDECKIMARQLQRFLDDGYWSGL